MNFTSLILFWDCEGCDSVFVKMATGAVPASFMGLKSRERGLGFVQSMDFVRVSDLQRVKFRRTKVLVISNQSSGSEIAELQPASEGSPLLGILSFLCFGEKLSNFY